MPTPDETVSTILDAADWNARVARIRRIPQQHGTDQHAAIYAAVATNLYVPNLAPDFAYVHWRPDYELADFLAAYESANKATEGFTRVGPDELAELFHRHPQTLKVFRVLVGFTTQEFAASTKLVAEQNNLGSLTNGLVKSLERGTSTTFDRARAAALTVHSIMTGQLFEEPAGTLKRKLAKPDTAEGWQSVQRLAREGVPFGVFLHQRHYGGAFRQLLDATSIQRGDIIKADTQHLNALTFVAVDGRSSSESRRRGSHEDHHRDQGRRQPTQPSLHLASPLSITVRPLSKIKNAPDIRNPSASREAQQGPMPAGRYPGPS